MFNTRSNGKLMLTGEYLVLKGAESLALPTKLGQELCVIANGNKVINWKTNVRNEFWFECQITIDDFFVIQTNNKDVSDTLVSIFKVVRDLNSSFLIEGVDVTTNLEFDLDWGLGSSSSLIANIASWANCNPYILNRKVFKGSGYDIACATSLKPVLYRLNDEKPEVKTVEFNPDFKDHLAFVWLKRKQDTRKGITLIDQEDNYESEIKELNDLTKSILKNESLNGFIQVLACHEQLISKVINVEPVHKRLFPEFDGVVKSLGAWGGDFVLAASNMSFNDMKNYFKEKGFYTVLKYTELVI